MCKVFLVCTQRKLIQSGCEWIEITMFKRLKLYKSLLPANLCLQVSYVIGKYKCHQKCNTLDGIIIPDTERWKWIWYVYTGYIWINASISSLVFWPGMCITFWYLNIVRHWKAEGYITYIPMNNCFLLQSIHIGNGNDVSPRHVIPNQY